MPFCPPIPRPDPHELRRLLALMLPLYIGNLMQMGMGVIDTIVAGHAGAGELAGVALACALVAPVLCSVGAVISMVAPMISRLRGAGCAGKVGYLLLQAKWLALGLTLLECAVLAAGHFLWPLVTEDAALRATADAYIGFFLLGVPGNLLLRVALAYFEGSGRTRPGMLFSLMGLLLNIPLNLILVFGCGPIPALGGAGCGLATAIIYWCMALGALGLMRLSPGSREQLRTMLATRRPDLRLMGRILRLGSPVAFATLSEVGFFCVITMIIAPLGERVVAANQVSISISSLIFMYPLSLGWAVAIRAGYHIGAENARAFRRMVHTALPLLAGGVLFFMLGTLMGRDSLIALYTQDPEVHATARVLLLLCALYQIPDGIQSFLNGLLRGCQDTKAISRATIIGYWGVGFPLACVLIRTDWVVPAMGAAGAWVSFIVSLSLVALLLGLRYRRTARRLFPEEKNAKNRAREPKSRHFA